MKGANQGLQIIAVPQDDPNLIVGYGVRSMKKVSFFSVYNSKDKGSPSAVFSDLTKGIKTLRFLPWTKNPAYKLIGSSGSQILIIDLYAGSNPQLSILKTISVFSTGQIIDLAISESNSSTTDLICLSSEQQLARIKQIDRLLADN